MYQPNTTDAPKDIQGLVAWAIAEFRRIGSEFNTQRAAVIFKPLGGAPDRVYPCMVVYFLSTAPEAVSGEGLYRRNAANSAWVFAG